MPPTKSPSKQKRQIDFANVHITATFNNTIVTIADQANNPVIVASTGMHGFTGTRKSTPHAATITADAAMQKAKMDHGVRKIDIYVRGIGPGREAALRVMRACGCDVEKIVDVTPVPHNGVRAPKLRRV
ncbi:MAG: 30S ribosomal protein S11 [bacterium]